MRALLTRFRVFVFYAATFSLAINVLLLAPPLYMLQVFDRVFSSRSDATLMVLTAAAVGALIVMMLLDLLRVRLLASAAAGLDRLLGPRLVSRLFSEARRPGSKEVQFGLRDLTVLRGFLTGPGILALLDAPWLPLYLLVIFVFHPLLGAVATAGAAILLMLAYLNQRVTRGPLEELQLQGRRAGRFIDFALRNADAVAGLGMIDSVTRKWERENHKVLELHAMGGYSGGLISGLTKFMRQLVQVVMLGMGAWLVIDQHVTPGVMMAATLLLGRALAPVETAISGWKSLAEARSAYRRLDSLLSKEAEPPMTTALPVPRGAIGVERAVFAVRGQDRPILKGVNFELEAGAFLGLIGPSASGKSTLARLLIGVWKPLTGVVRLDGADLASWPRHSVGPYIGYLPQELELFTGTVAENIARLGDCSSTAVVDAARRANAHDLILRLPNGYDTPIGEGGLTLSGGQRQRIALARALYGDPKLVVLDEPNANLDTEGEEALIDALLKLKQEGVTLIVIAHRPSVLANADKLLVLREGTVEVFGPRAEVMSRLTRTSAPAGAIAAGSPAKRAQG